MNGVENRFINPLLILMHGWSSSMVVFLPEFVTKSVVGRGFSSSLRGFLVMHFGALTTKQQDFLPHLVRHGLGRASCFS